MTDRELQTIDATPAAMINKPGIYTICADDYHADPCPAPSLSASIAKILWQKSAKHAWHAHPKLNPDFTPIDNGIFDLGTASHSILLEGDACKIVVVDAADWRKKAAQMERDAAYDAGMTPLLTHQFEQVKAMAGIAAEFIEQTELASIFEDGQPEQSMFAEWNGIWLRSRTDWLRADRRLILDYKTVGQSAAPEQFARSALFNMGHDIQAAMYTMVNGLTGGPPDASFCWLVQETDPPYACYLVGASPAVLDIGEQKLMLAIDTWQKCLKSGVWPAYDTRIAYPDPPPWELARIEQATQEAAQ